MSKQPPPAPPASAADPCPTVIQIVGRPGTGSLPSTIAPPDHPNCIEDHPANSKQCQAWHTEKEILKVKYTRNISFPEARKTVESYTAAPGKSYASITKTVGVTVSCVDAATQTDPVLITAAPQSSSYNAASTEASASTQKDMSEPLTQKEKQKQDKADKKLKQLIRETLPKPRRNTQARTPDSKQRGKEKSVQNTDRQPKGSDDPIRQHNRFSNLEKWRQRNLHHVLQRELLCAYLLNKNRSNLLLYSMFSIHNKK